MKSLSSDRLAYKQIGQSDFEFIRHYLSDAERTKFLPLEKPYPEEDLCKWFTGRMSHWERHQFGTFIVRLKDSVESIGYCGLEFVRNTDFIDVRYGLMQDVWGKGYGFEAVREIIQFGFEHLRLKTIYGAAVPENYASIHILNKSGMRPDASFDSYGSVVDSFSITKDDFTYCM